MNVAFFVFNRPEITARVFAEIRQARPERLFLIADGPRIGHATDQDRCRQVREVVRRVDWECDVGENFSEINLGCGARVASGLDWVFEQVEEAIILEDDCLPAPDFFSYAQAMLARYTNDERVMHVAGSSLGVSPRNYPYTYFFSRYICIWGWATWRRAWRYFDVGLSKWPEFRDQGWIERLGLPRRDEWDFRAAMDATAEGYLNTWDSQWWFACWAQSGLAILPTVNLVSNIGFGVDSTHTREVTWEAAIPLGELGTLRHPPFLVADETVGFPPKAPPRNRLERIARMLSSELPGVREAMTSLGRACSGIFSSRGTGS